MHMIARVISDDLYRAVHEHSPGRPGRLRPEARRLARRLASTAAARPALIRLDRRPAPSPRGRRPTAISADYPQSRPHRRTSRRLSARYADYGVAANRPGSSWGSALSARWRRRLGVGRAIARCCGGRAWIEGGWAGAGSHLVFAGWLATRTFTSWATVGAPGASALAVAHRDAAGGQVVFALDGVLFGAGDVELL